MKASLDHSSLIYLTSRSHESFHSEPLTVSALAAREQLTSINAFQRSAQWMGGGHALVEEQVLDAALAHLQTMRSEWSPHEISFERLYALATEQWFPAGLADRPISYADLRVVLGKTLLHNTMSELPAKLRTAVLKGTATPREILASQAALRRQLKLIYDHNAPDWALLVAQYQSRLSAEEQQFLLAPDHSAVQKELLLNTIQTQHPDVVIIGAGIAGCTAANALLDHDMRVLILEADSIPGGRVRNLSVSGMTVDLGAAWLHQGAINPIKPVVEALGFKTFPDRTRHLAVRHDKGKIIDETPLFYEAVQALKASWRDDSSIAAQTGDHIPAISHTNAWTNTALAHLVPLQAGVDSDALSIRDYLNIEDETSDYQVEGGLSAALSALTSGLAIRFNTNITHLQHDQHGVTLTAHREASQPLLFWHARQVICTPSTGVLQAGGMTFDPPLPAERTSMFSHLRMGYFEKVIMVFEPAVFEHVPENCYLHIQNQPGEAIEFLMHSAQQPMIIALAGGSFANHLLSHGTEYATDYVLDRLSSHFGSEIRHYFKTSEATHWHRHPFTHGAYTAAMPEFATDRLQYSAAVGPIHFAGEAGHPSWGSCVPGAYLSGMAAARRIIESIERHTVEDKPYRGEGVHAI